MAPCIIELGLLLLSRQRGRQCVYPYYYADEYTPPIADIESALEGWRGVYRCTVEAVVFVMCINPWNDKTSA